MGPLRNSPLGDKGSCSGCYKMLTTFALKPVNVFFVVNLEFTYFSYLQAYIIVFFYLKNLMSFLMTGCLFLHINIFLFSVMGKELKIRSFEIVPSLDKLLIMKRWGGMETCPVHIFWRNS